MADKLGARKDSSFKAISTAPDICKTPVGNTVVPIPYPIVSDLSQSVQTVPNVRFNGKPCYVLDQSIIPTCTGDEPGTAMGVRSGTNKNKTEPTSGSSTVRAGKKKVVRERDTCTMNNGNTNGIFVTQPGAGCTCSKGKPTKDTNPPPKDETKKEKTFKEKLGEWWDNTKKESKEAVKHPIEGTKGAAKGTANIVPELGEVFMKSSMLDTANQMDQAAGFQELFGNAEKAKEYSDAASNMRASVDSVNLPKFDMSNSAQAGGDKIFTAVTLITGLAGLVKNGIKAGVKGTAKLGSKIETTAVKEASAVAREEKVISDIIKETGIAEKATSKVGIKVKKKKLKGPKLSQRVADTFEDGTYVNRKLKTNETFYKYHGSDNRTGKKVSWLTNKKYATEDVLRKELAIRKDWGVKIDSVSKFDVPKGTWVSEGKAAAQGAGYPGGGYQAVIQNVPKTWVQTTKAFP